MASLQMNRLPWWGQLVVFTIIGAAFVGAYYYMYEWPRRDQLDVRKAELQAIGGRIAAGQATARKLPEFLAEVGQLEERLDGLRAILPEEKDVANLLRRIQTMAAQSNLVIKSFVPKPITTKELHAEWPIGLELEGTYHDVGVFLDSVSKFPRIINVGSIAMTGAEKPSKPSATVQVSCTAMTFVLLDKSPQQEAAPPAVPSKRTE